MEKMMREKDDLWICRRKVGGGDDPEESKEGQTLYHYYEAIEPYTPSITVEELEASKEVIKHSYSHVDGRDLFAELRPRKTLDIKKRVDGVETWYEGDWLTDLGKAIRNLQAVIEKLED